MKTTIVYHSHSGITRSVAEKIHENLQGDIVEVTPEKPYSALMLIPKGCYRARKGEKDEVVPKKIDISESDLIIFASPVWAGKPTPIMNGAIESLEGYRGKKAFALMTCGRASSGNEAVIPFIESLKEKGLEIMGKAVLDRDDVKSDASIEAVISDIQSLSGRV